jgi:hypothetical protein
MNGIPYFVTGESLYSVASDGVTTFIDTLPGTDRCGFATNGTQLAITNGINGYIYTVADGLVQITDPDLQAPKSVAFVDLQFIFDQPNGQFVTSAINDASNIDSLDFATAEAGPDDILRVSCRTSSFT